MRDDCGCCTGTDAATPVRPDNPPALDAVAYRTGTHARFLASMLASLSRAGDGALRTLQARDPADPVIAFLDACAVVDDVLTFHQERFAQESWLGTATERRSLVQLARAVGHEPRPGVAATAWLAFTIDDTPGTPESTTIDAGTRVLSVPGKDERPQPFETIEPVTARALWNAMPARALRPQAVTSAMTRVVVQGTDLGVRQGDRVLVVAGTTTSQRDARAVQRVVVDTAAGTTTLEIAAIPGASPGDGPVFGIEIGHVMEVDGVVGTGIGIDAGVATTLAGMHAASSLQQFQYVWARFNTPQPAATPADVGVHVFRQRAAAFGHNAPRWATLPQVVQGREGLVPGRHFGPDDAALAQYPDDWDALSLAQAATVAGAAGMLDLDTAYPQVVPDSWLLLETTAGTTASDKVTATRELTRADFALSGRVTRCALRGDASLAGFPLRDTAIHVRSERLPLARVPIDDTVSGHEIVLDRWYPGLAPGRAVLVSGMRADLPTLEWHEVRRLAAVRDGETDLPEDGRRFTTLVLDTPLDHAYVRATVRVNANVAFATHGEARSEVMASGDGALRFRTVALRQPPLTHVPAPTPTGARATLEVRVDGIAWTERADLLDRPADERSYVVRTDDDGTTRVTFNAPLPSGSENVVARYRSGIGLAGRVKERQLTLLQSRPLGVRSVVNPLAAAGGEDPEAPDAIRRGAGLQGLTLGRLVTLTDYRDFARAFAGFAKAHVTMASDGERPAILVTVAPAGGGPLAVDSASFASLVDAMRRLGDPNVAFAVRPWRRVPFRIGARIAIAAGHLPDTVRAAVEAALRTAFGFDARDFGQPVAASALVACMQGVVGVDHVHLTALRRTAADTSAEPGPPARLHAAVPVPGRALAGAPGAELLVLDDVAPALVAIAS